MGEDVRFARNSQKTIRDLITKHEQAQTEYDSLYLLLTATLFLNIQACSCTSGIAHWRCINHTKEQVLAQEIELGTNENLSLLTRIIQTLFI